MTTFSLPPNTVRFYNDGPWWPGESLDVERTYREAFLAGAREAAAWSRPDPKVIEEARRERRRVREEAEVFVPSSQFFNCPGLSSKQVVFRAGHEVEAARTRGRCQALEFAGQLWLELTNAGMSNEEVIELVIKPWVAAVEAWLKAEVDLERLSWPPRPEDLLDEAQRPMIKAVQQ